MELSILMSVIKIVENVYVSLTGQEKNVNWQVNEFMMLFVTNAFEFMVYRKVSI